MMPSIQYHAPSAPEMPAELYSCGASVSAASYSMCINSLNDSIFRSDSPIPVYSSMPDQDSYQTWSTVPAQRRASDAGILPSEYQYAEQLQRVTDTNSKLQEAALAQSMALHQALAQYRGSSTQYSVQPRGKPRTRLAASSTPVWQQEQQQVPHVDSADDVAAVTDTDQLYDMPYNYNHDMAVAAAEPAHMGAAVTSESMALPMHLRPIQTSLTNKFKQQQPGSSTGAASASPGANGLNLYYSRSSTPGVLCYSSPSQAAQAAAHGDGRIVGVGSPAYHGSPGSSSSLVTAAVASTWTGSIDHADAAAQHARRARRLSFMSDTTESVGTVTSSIWGTATPMDSLPDVRQRDTRAHPAFAAERSGGSFNSSCGKYRAANDARVLLSREAGLLAATAASRPLHTISNGAAARLGRQQPGAGDAHPAAAAAAGPKVLAAIQSVLADSPTLRGTASKLFADAALAMERDAAARHTPSSQPLQQHQQQGGAFADRAMLSALGAPPAAAAAAASAPLPVLTTASSCELTQQLQMLAINNAELRQMSGMDGGSGAPSMQPLLGAVGSQFPPPYTPSHKLFVGNIGPSVTEQDLLQWFAQCGQVTNVKIMYNSRKMHKPRDKWRSREYGFVDFATATEATNAIAVLNGAKLPGLMKDGLGIIVQYAKP